MAQVQVEVPGEVAHTEGMIAILYPRNDWTAWEIGEQLWLSTKWGDRSMVRRFPQHLPPTKNIEKISRELAKNADVVIFLSVDVPPSRWDKSTREILRETKGKLLLAVSPIDWRERVLEKIKAIRGNLNKVEHFSLESLEDLDQITREAVQKHRDIQFKRALKILALLGLLWWTFKES